MEPVTHVIAPANTAGDTSYSALVLRPPKEADLAALGKIFDDPAVIEWTLVPVPWDQAERAVYLERVAEAWRAGSARWVIADADDEVHGTLSLIRLDDRTARLTYQVAPWARRHRVALRACHAAAAFAFDEMGVKRLVWDAKVGNHLSRLIAFRLGFQPEGIQRSAIEQRGEPIDLWTGAMLPGELRALDDPPDGYRPMRRRTATLMRPQPTLKTAKPDLRLRPLRDDDIDLIRDACRDTETIRWTTIPTPYRREHAEDFIHNFAGGGWRDGTSAVFALADSEDLYCGGIDLRFDAARPQVGEIGFNTAPWARGQGYMTAATRAICDFGFNECGLSRIEWKAFVGNDASRIVAERAGFTIEGTLRQDAMQRGLRLDSWIGAIVKADQ